MAKVDFAANRRQAEDAGQISSGNSYKLKEGQNRIRLMSLCLAHPGEFKGTKTFKWLCYVLDRRDQKVKPFFMAHTIYKAIEALQSEPDYAFVEVPMPYDLTITAKGAGTKEVEYSVIPARKETPLTPEEELKLEEMKPLADLQAAIKAKDVKGKEPQPPAHTDDELVTVPNYDDSEEPPF